ncbi:hypothetical protein ZWY2020_015813 [Hordeum vulgare]|nr:hypothetical protein ZWY2020_015813 [Hordeum vulgare]
MEATAACSSTFLARTLASSPLPHHCRSRVRVGNYVVPLDAAPSGITRPLVEILNLTEIDNYAFSFLSVGVDLLLIFILHEKNCQFRLAHGLSCGFSCCDV